VAVFIDKTVKTKGLRRGICNASKRQDLVRFSWKFSNDLVIPGFMYRVRDEQLAWPMSSRKVGRSLWYKDTVYLSQYLYDEIKLACQIRWPSQARLNWLNRNGRA
jgi:hypothetical protein